MSRRKLRKAYTIARRAGNPRSFRIQITTKGNSMAVVRRGIDYVEQAYKAYPLLRTLVTVEVVTEELDDQWELGKFYPWVETFVLPEHYQTPNKTGLKARALHYMVELHRRNPRNGYVVHYDEESVYTPDNLARLCATLMRTPIGISEGTISYGLDWEMANPICRTLESNRPFGCHECYLMMTHPVPLHLHGSNLVIQETIENEIGWDIGKYKNNPLIAEDLVFGLAVYLKYGKSVFGWHGTEMVEQPPFTLKAAYKQRERWCMGALQGVAHVKDLPGYNTLSKLDRFKIQVIIRIRVWTYALGAPVSTISLLVWSGAAMVDAIDILVGIPLHLTLTLWAIPGFVMWVAANQIGLAQNLASTKLSKLTKLREHLIVLAITPIAGLFDTAGPFVAVIKWSFGIKSVKWIPTEKSYNVTLKDI